MDYIEIKGYKSIKEARIELGPINILIGANGSGKSNFISFFEFLNIIYNQKLKEYVALSGGVDKFLHKGSKTTQEIKAHVTFDEGVNGYSFGIRKGEDSFIFIEENVWYYRNDLDIADYKTEANLKTNSWHRSRYTRNHLNQFKKYHFHDTGRNSPFNMQSNIENDSYFLYEKGENLASFLFNIQKKNQIVYNRIIKTIQSIAPYFSDFFFQPNSEEYLRLQWQDKYSSTIYGATDLSDGTIRFIALTTLFMQPDLPGSIIIDEPELGLHPFAIAKLAGLIQSAAAKKTRVIVATQSTDLISHFQPEDIITVDQHNGESSFKRLESNSLAIWLEDYSIDDLWKRNIIKGGQP
ncbi:MAG: ATPase [Segetibacter sp.]|nr:ATPase [Segetibacter sp.]